MMNKIITTLFFFLVNIAAIAETSERYFFEAYWGGFKVGEMRIIANQTDSDYNIITDINTAGIAKYATNYSSTNITSGSIKGDKYIPKHYQSMWKRKKKSQEIDVSFSPKGDVTEEKLVPPEWEGKRPAVGAEFKKSVFDPITAAIVSRETIRKELAKNPHSQAEFLIPVFDAKRRFDVVLKIHGYEKIQFGGKQREFLHINIMRKPLAGYTEDDLQEMAEEEQNIDFYLNKDFIPEYGVAKAKVGRATIKLVK